MQLQGSLLLRCVKGTPSNRLIFTRLKSQSTSFQKPSSRFGIKRSSNPRTTSATKEGRELFQFGNFSGLQEPKKQIFESSGKLLEKITSFDELRIFPTVRAAMIKEIKRGYNFKNTYVKDVQDMQLKPTPVQIAAIKKINQVRGQKPKLSLPKIVNKKNPGSGQDILNDLMRENDANKLKVFTIAAETGSGKTWAYLAPLLSKLKEEDLELFKSSVKTYQEAQLAQNIRSVILLPTHELVEQVYKMVNGAGTVKYDLEKDVGEKFLNDPNFSNFISLPENKDSLNLRVVKWGAGDAHKVLFDKLERNGRVDVLITTPSKIESLNKLTNINRPFKHFGFVNYVVVDEADTLMDKSWILDTNSVLKRFNRCKDLIFCSATIPKEFYKTMSKIFQDEHSIINIITPSLHKIPKQIVLKVIDAQSAPYHGSKTRCLAQALYAIHNDGTEQGFVKRILIFVNEKKDVEPLAETLIKKYGHREEDIVGVTGRDTPEDRLSKIEPFLRPAELVEDDIHQSKIKVLITTDLLARGLNFDSIKNVILMDLPNTSVDLVHRVGRTGRMRQSGRVFVIIDKKTRKSFIKGLPNVIKKGVALG